MAGAEKSFSEETFWTTFAFEGVDPDVLHCTHKFLGEQPLNKVRLIRGLIDEYFTEVKPFQVFTPVFDSVDFFGKDAEVRVLRCTTAPLTWFYPELRKILDLFQADTYEGGYKPHVTTPNLFRISYPVTRYCLMQGKEILKEWR